MATAVTMPRLGLSMVEGTVVEWKAKPGDEVAKGDVILVIESEKAEVEVEAPASGRLSTIYVEPGTTVPIGALLAALTAAGEELDAAAFAAAFVPEVEGAPATAREGEAAPPPPRRPAAAPGGGGAPGAKVAPAARAAAKRLGVDLSAVAGSGPGGRILPEDVERAAREAGAAGGPIAHAVAGAGPAVALVAGFAVDASGWRRQVDDLARDHAVVTIDHRGIAGSPPLRAASVGPAEMARDAAEALEAAGRGPYAVVGASLGAAVALELACARPDLVRALVLLTPVAVRDARLEAVLRSWAEGDEPAAEARVRGMLPWLFSRTFLSDRARREAAASALRAMAGRTPAAALRAQLAGLVEWLDGRIEELPDVAAPTLILAAGDDLLAPLAHAEALRGAVPRAALEIVPGAGHALAVERAAETSERIRRFAAAGA